MAPSKKREKDAAAAVAANVHNGGSNANNITNNNNNNNAGSASNGNGSSGVGGVGGGATASAAAASTNAATTANATAADTSKLNGSHQEQELFLQAFEKPTQIYRFLRNRHGTSPIFLNRTLSYMKDRMSRNNKKRNTFKVNSILDAVIQKSESVSNNFLSIIYNGLFDKSSNSDQWCNAGDVVSTESTLFKITKSKRKDSTSDFQEILSQTTNVIYNPHDKIGQFSAISIPVQSMHPLGDQHTIYKLLFRIEITPNELKSNKNVQEEETLTKRSKTCNKVYGCELIVFEKNIGLIPEGDYEAALQELSSTGLKSFSPKKRSWETLPDNYIPLSMKFDVFNQFPTLKFRLTWSTIELPSSIDAKDLSKYGGFSEASNNGVLNGIFAMDNNETTATNTPNGKNENGNGTNDSTQINHNNNCIKTNPITVKTEKIQIVYNFLYSNNTRQQTEYTQEVICPWCTLDCLRLYALLKHLKLCHARFNFTYQPAGNGARIDVTINDTYDGSYAGSPYDLAGPSGCSFARTCGPVRRTTVTNLLVCRPRRQKTCLDEFLVLDEDDLSNQRPYITGHNRLYHHTETCLPVHPKELDIDSEGESDPLWLRQKTIQMIDEFTDVNEGEKELMKLWNLHVMKHGYVGDCQLPLACEMFLDVKGDEIIQKNLYRNFILHMCSLFDYGLVAPETVYKVVQKLQGMLSKNSDGQILMSKQREAQLKYWLDVGIHKEDEQKLKSPQKSAAANSNGTANSSTLTLATVDANGAAVAVALGSGSAANAAADAKAMHPPVKRSATAVKRASMHPQNGQHNGADKASGAGSNKSVAKKTVAQEASDASGSTGSGRSKRHVLDKSEGRLSLDGNKSVKRKLLGKDAAPQVTSKRSRSDSHQANITITHAASTTTTAAAGATAISTTTTTILTATTTTTLPKRLVTRRQSIAGDNVHHQHHHHLHHQQQQQQQQHHHMATTSTATNTRSSAGKNSAASAAHHALRTRLSVPLTKVDKR